MSEAMPRCVEIGDAVIFQKLHDEVVVLNMTTQEYFGLDDVGAAMWDLLVELGDIDAVAQRLTANYAVDQERVLTDLQVLVGDLLAAGLLKTAPSQLTAD